jgi:hypothetical protein
MRLVRNLLYIYYDRVKYRPKIRKLNLLHIENFDKNTQSDDLTMDKKNPKLYANQNLTLNNFTMMATH